MKFIYFNKLIVLLLLCCNSTFSFSQRTSYVFDLGYYGDLNGGPLSSDSTNLASVNNEWYDFSYSDISFYSVKTGVSQEITKKIFLLSGLDFIVGKYQIDFSSGSLNANSKLEWYTHSTAPMYINIPFELHFKSMNAGLASDKNNSIFLGFYIGYNYSFLMGYSQKLKPGSENLYSENDSQIKSILDENMKPSKQFGYFTIGGMMYAWDIGLFLGMTTGYNVTPFLSENGIIGAPSYLFAGLRLYVKHKKHKRASKPLNIYDEKLSEYY